MYEQDVSLAILNCKHLHAPLPPSLSALSLSLSLSLSHSLRSLSLSCHSVIISDAFQYRCQVLV